MQLFQVQLDIRFLLLFPCYWLLFDWGLFSCSRLQPNVFVALLVLFKHLPLKTSLEANHVYFNSLDGAPYLLLSFLNCKYLRKFLVVIGVSNRQLFQLSQLHQLSQAAIFSFDEALIALRLENLRLSADCTQYDAVQELCQQVRVVELRRVVVT